MATVAYGQLPFQQQIAFFRSKKGVLTESWTDVWEAEHDHAFMVAGANRIDLLADFREAVRAAVEDGETLAQFRARFDSIVAKHGWDYNGGRNWRSRVIYETNLRQSYNAGRYAQQMKLAKAMPYIRYKHSDAVQHPRPVHQSWNDKIWRADDPVWNVIFPANGWGCQCYTESLSERDLRKLGKTGPDPSPNLQWVDVMVGQRSPGGPRLVRTVEGIDPGFAYAPGAGADGWPTPRGSEPVVTPPALQQQLVQAAQDVLRKSTRLPAPAAAAALRSVFALQRAQDAVQAGYATFQAETIADGAAGGARYLAGLLDGALVETLGARGIAPATAAISVRDSEVLRALADGLDAGLLAALPAWLRVPQAVLWDARSAELVYVARSGETLLAARVGVHGALPELRTVATLADTRTLADLPVLRGTLGA